MPLLDSSAGYDEFPVKVVKLASPILTPVLTHLCNLSLSSRFFLGPLKIARVFLIHESGSTHYIDNCKPIFILPSFSKSLEEAVHQQLMDYLITIVHRNAWKLPSSALTVCWVSFIHYQCVSWPVEVFDTVYYDILLSYYRLKILFTDDSKDIFPKYVECPRVSYTATSLSSFTNDIVYSADSLKFILFADDSTLRKRVAIIFLLWLK